MKQAVVAPSMMSLLYPPSGIAGYAREVFVQDVSDEAEKDIRSGWTPAHTRSSWTSKTPAPSSSWTPAAESLRGSSTSTTSSCNASPRRSGPGSACTAARALPQGSTHSLDVDYGDLLPQLFRLQAGTFYLSLASEPDPEGALKMTADQLRPGIRVFVGVTDPCDPRVETAEEVRDRVFRAARNIPANQLGTCDDAGFSPFADDQSTSRQKAFAKIRARVEGTKQAR
ncbi:hypothetical protein ACH4UR_26405 [Streptomyces lydicus]|uniref:hypothetical protein n=1 Tax=Streptomyces lydicus TaxID=47763 RepID=UPI0034088F1A